MPLVVIDPGHGGHDSGSSHRFGLKEEDVTLDISLAAANELRRMGIDVILTRESDIFLELRERAQIANEAGADVFCSIHCNSFSNTSAKGYEDYIHTSPLQKTPVLQEEMHTRLMNFYRQYGVRDRGKKSANFAVLRHTSMPAILTENLFISNPVESELLADPEFLREVGRAHAEGLRAFLGVSATSRNSVTPSSTSRPEPVRIPVSPGPAPMPEVGMRPVDPEDLQPSVMPDPQTGPPVQPRRVTPPTPQTPRPVNPIKDRIRELKEPTNLNEELRSKGVYRKGDRAWAIDHERGTSSVGIRKDGRIELFAKNGLGMRIDPVYDSISFFAPRMYFYTDEMDFFTDPLSMRWNKTPFNLKPVYNVITPVGPGQSEGMLLPYNDLPLSSSRAIARILSALGGSVV